MSGLKLDRLKHGQTFLTDGVRELKVLHTPGHTTDHCILFNQETKELFSGDCVLGEGTAVFEDLHDYMKSLELILNEKPSVIYPAHGNILKVLAELETTLNSTIRIIHVHFFFQNPTETIQYYINHRNERERQILNILETEQNVWHSDMDIVKVIYSEIPENLWIAAAKNVGQHLKKLEKEYKIQSKENQGSIVWKYLKC